MGKTLDRAEFRAMFNEHRDPVYRFLWRLTRDPHEAEDLTQETFVMFWRKQEQFRGEGSLQGYLRRIGYRLFLNSRSRLSASRPTLSLSQAPEASGPGDEAEVDRNESREFLVSRVLAALDSVPDRAREAFLLFRFAGGEGHRGAAKDGGVPPEEGTRAPLGQAQTVQGPVSVTLAHGQTHTHRRDARIGRRVPPSGG